MYKENGKLLSENLNCSFQFWFGDNKASRAKHTTEECKLMDVSESGQDTFRDTVYGNTMFSSIFGKYSSNYLIKEEDNS